jgi:hypothetical protein
MTDSFDHLKKLLDPCTEQERAALLDDLKARFPRIPRRATT